MIRRDLAFDDLEIDFDAHLRRKQAEYEKLQRVEQFAQSRRCRQEEILRYFGEEMDALAESATTARRGGKGWRVAGGGWRVWGVFPIPSRTSNSRYSALRNPNLTTRHPLPTIPHPPPTTTARHPPPVPRHPPRDAGAPQGRPHRPQRRRAHSVAGSMRQEPHRPNALRFRFRPDAEARAEPIEHLRLAQGTEAAGGRHADRRLDRHGARGAGDAGAGEFRHEPAGSPIDARRHGRDEGEGGACRGAADSAGFAFQAARRNARAGRRGGRRLGQTGRFRQSPRAGTSTPRR